MGEEFIWHVINPVGSIYSFTVVRRAFLPGAKPRVPFTVLQVQFDDAPGVTLLTNLADEADRPSVHVGAAIEVAFTEVQTPRGGPVTMPYVRLRQAAQSA